MKILLDSYVFKENGAKAEIFYTEGEEGIPEEDCLELVVTPEEGTPSGFALRPDEALLLIRLLANGINRSVSVWETSFDPEAYK